MSSVLIVYYSRTGFTKKYAESIACACGGRAVDLKHLSRGDLKRAPGIVFGTRAFAGTLPKLKKLRRLLAHYPEKPYAFFVTGAMPADAEESVQRLWDNNLTPEEQDTVPHFYLPSGLNYEAMGFLDKVMMSGLRQFLAKNPAQTPEEQVLAQTIAASFDQSSDTYIEPVVACIKEWSSTK